MKAIDTNIVVRFLTGENAPQTAIARQVITQGDVFVSTTVMLESAWVLRSVYGFGRQEVIRALRAFVGLPGVTVEAPALLSDAFDHAESGMDFADALHLDATMDCDGFVTFDRALVKAAGQLGMQVINPET